MANVAVNVRVTGRVQGVAFRAWTRDAAERLGLSGWVRNEPDGSVRAHFVGPAADVGSMLEALKTGPPAARVTDTEVEQATADARLTGFRITR